MQVLFSKSFERTEDSAKQACEQNDGSVPGLNLFEGFALEKFKSVDKTKFKVPHMGWNKVKVSETPKSVLRNKLFSEIGSQKDFYYVHSYAAILSQTAHDRLKAQDLSVASSDYINEYIAMIWDEKRNLGGCQFHPEKSSKHGLKLLENFVDL